MKQMNRAWKIAGFFGIVACLAVQGGERRILLEVYRDKMAGAWIGQSVGVGYGWPTEFRFCEKLVPEEKMPVWKPESVNETFNQDDLYVEMTFIRTLETRGLDVSCREAGIDFANSRYRLWCANDRARDNLRRGIAAPDSGHPAFHASPDDIDYQIEADFSGILAPGLPQAAIRLGETFGRIMNYGDGLWAGQFVGGLYAAAYFSSDRVANVESALACIPSGSLYAQMVRDLLGWYRADPKDWQGAWRKAVDKYGRKGLPTVGKVSNSDINVKINGAMVLLGYLFGEGDPDRTMYISTRGGYDSDCNPSSACGVLFTSIGAKALPPRFTEKLDRDRKWEFTDYTYPKLMAVCEKLTRELVVREGGRIERDADGKEWFVIPARKPTPSPFWTTEKPGPVTNARYSPAEMEKVLYAPNEGMGRQSTRVRGKDYAKTPGRVRVTWDGHIWPGWNGILADWTLEGYADIAAQKPIRENDLFWAASNTKGVAAALVLTYVDEGRIGLDDPVEKYFPEWKDICVNDKSGRRAPKTKPTVRQVLSHTSGLPFFPKMPIDQYSMRELVTMAVEKGLDADPGTAYRYSNWGIDVAAAIVEQVGGKPWETALQERILDPLEMKDTTFWPTTNQLARIVVPYHFPKDGGTPIRGRGVDQFRSDVTDRTRHAEAGGGLYSTAGDFLKFYVMVASKGVGANGKRILSEEICREWYRNQVPAELKKQYSFGMNVDPEKGTIGHGGAYATHAEANWKDRTCVVDFVQKCGKPAKKPLKFLLMSDTHVESDFMERGHPVYTCWKPGDHKALVETYRFISKDPFCRDVSFALFCGDQINTGYSWCQNDLDDEMKNYFRTLGSLDLYGKSVGTDLSAFKFRTQSYVCRQNLGRGQGPFEVQPPPLASRVIAIQGNHDTGCPDFYRDCAFQCGDVRFITFFASYVGLPAPKGKYRSTGKISDETLAFVEKEMTAAAADPEIRHIVLACHWSIVLDDPKNFACPIYDAVKENGFCDNRRKLLALAEKYGCDLFINGHEHNNRWPVGKVGNLADINCGTVADAGSFAIVEISDDKAVFTVYSCAVANEEDGVCRIAKTPQRQFVREIPLRPRR